MSEKYKLYLFFLITYSFSYSQVGIGTITPNISTILEVVSSNKGILLPRIPLTSSSDTTTIINGNVISLLIYNTAKVNDIIPGYHYWDGSKWIRLSTNNARLFSGNGLPNATNTPNPVSGDIYVALPSGDLYTFNGVIWGTKSAGGISSDLGNLLTLGSDGLPFFNDNVMLKVIVNNGLSKNGNNDIQLGGTLSKPTSIDTNNTNTLAIKGLVDANTVSDEVVTIQPTTGILTKTALSNLFEEYVFSQTASNGQIQFTTPIAISSINKVNVYRNGARIDATLVNANTIQLEVGVICFANDEIRIVQYK